jgi:hypothetical protein
MEDTSSSHEAWPEIRSVLSLQLQYCLLLTSIATSISNGASTIAHLLKPVQNSNGVATTAKSSTHIN